MIISSIGQTFSGNSGSSQSPGTSNQTDPASGDTEASDGVPSGGIGSSGTTGSTDTSSGSSHGQAGSQSAIATSSGQTAASTNGVRGQATALAEDTPDTPTDIGALRIQALAVQKQLNTEMLIKSLGATPETDASLLSEPESDAAVPLAIAAYAEHFPSSVAETGTNTA